MKAVLLGATRGMGRAVARRLAERGDTLFLLGRSPDDLSRSARDLEIRSARRPTRDSRLPTQQPNPKNLPASGSVGFATCDLLEPKGFAAALDRADDALDGFDAVIVSAGIFAPQDALESDPERCERLLTIDFTNTILFCEEARRRLMARGGGTLCVFSSVAGERARKPVALYGAAKAGLSHYLEGLDHRFRLQGLRTVCVKPGFVRTGMTAALEPPPFAGDPDGVARVVVRALDRGTPVVYAPPIWRWILSVIRRLPRAVMRRIGF